MTGSPERIGTLAPERILCLLAEGEVEVEGLIPWSSNATLLVTVEDQEDSCLAVYKPQRGERRLWDFPHGTLGQREVAAYLVSEALGWGLVPPTILRSGPYGLGSLQFFVSAREGLHYFSIQDDERYAQDLKRLAAFDVIANNADRKSGHCLIDKEGRMWAIDNALTFHAEPKLRTVIWDFSEQLLPVSEKQDLRSLLSTLSDGKPPGQQLSQLLDENEIEALRGRLASLIRAGRYPVPGPGRSVPWPLV